MELHHEVTIRAPAHAVWRIIGERFMHIADWAAPIEASDAVDGAEPGAGAVRTCRIAAFGPVPAGTIHERLTAFDPDRRTFAYEAIAGLPSFVARACNRWSVEATGPDTCIVRTDAELHLRGLARMFAWLIRWQMQSGAARVCRELAHFAECGELHPRKRTAVASERASA